MITNQDDFEFGVDSRYQSKTDRDDDTIKLMKARIERFTKLPKEQIVRAKLLQLKLQMEEYLSKSIYDQGNHFTRFLEQYINSIYTNRSEFARDISVNPTFLSRIINKHQEPKDDFFHKLMIHSEKAFNHVGDFKKNTWIKVYYHEKMCNTMAKQEKWRPEVEKEVTISKLV